MSAAVEWHKAADPGELAGRRAAEVQAAAEVPGLDMAGLRKILRSAAGATGEGRKKASRALFRFLRGQLSD